MSSSDPLLPTEEWLSPFYEYLNTTLYQKTGEDVSYFVLQDHSGNLFRQDYQAVESIRNYQGYLSGFGLLRGDSASDHNLTALFDKSGDRTYVNNTKEYLWGLVAVGALVLGAFVGWGVILIVWMMCGGRRKPDKKGRWGFLTGAPLTRSETEYDRERQRLRLQQINGDDTADLSTASLLVDDTQFHAVSSALASSKKRRKRCKARTQKSVTFGRANDGNNNNNNKDDWSHSSSSSLYQSAHQFPATDEGDEIVVQGGDNYDDVDVGSGDWEVDDASFQRAAMEHRDDRNDWQRRFGLADPFRSRPTRVRLAFLASGLICIVFGILMVAKGISNLQTSINVVGNSAYDLYDICNSALIVLEDAVQEASKSGDTIRSLLNDDLTPDTEFCPYPYESSNLSTTDDVLLFLGRGNNSELNELQELYKEALQHRDELLASLDELDDFENKTVQDAVAFLRDVADYAERVSDASDTYGIRSWQSLIVVIPYTVLPSFLMVGAILALFGVSWGKCFQRLLHWFVLPVFITMTVVAYTFAAVMIIMAGVNSDFCLPGGYTDSTPDRLLLDIVKVVGYDNTTFVFEIAAWYCLQCRENVTDPLADLRAIQPVLTTSWVDTNLMLAVLDQDEGVEELAAACNRDYDVVIQLLVEMEYILEVLMIALERLLELTKCGRLIPLYTDSIYDAGCQYSPRAVFWVFAGCLVLGVFGMILITLRSAMKPTRVLKNAQPRKLAAHRAKKPT